MDNFQEMIINELQKYDSTEKPEINPFASNKTSGDHYYTINYRGMEHICYLCQRKMHIKNERKRKIKTCIDHVLIVMNIKFYTYQCPQCKKVFSMFGKIKSHYLPPIRNEVIRRYQMKYSRDKIADDLELKKTTVTEIIEDYRTKKNNT